MSATVSIAVVMCVTAGHGLLSVQRLELLGLLPDDGKSFMLFPVRDRDNVRHGVHCRG